MNLSHMSNLILLSNQSQSSDAYMITGQEGVSIGGGEVLDKLGGTQETWNYMDGELINHFNNFTYYKVGLCVLILLIFAIIALKILGIRTVTKDAAVRAELGNVRQLRRTEAALLAKQRRLQKFKTFIRSIGLEPSQVQVDYMNYNLRRADIMAPGGDRALDAYEFNAYVKIGAMLTALICIGVMFLVNLSVGFIILCLSLLGWNIIPNMVVRSEAVKKDAIIRDNFFDFYAELHYILKTGGATPLAKKIRSYTKGIRNIPEMVRFADRCADLMDTYGEYEATTYISKEYKEIPEVGKLMRLIRQFHDNADIVNDLEGFREQLMTEKQLKMEDAQKRLVQKARMSFNILMIILVQAILSAMAIYLPDLTNMSL